MYADFQALLEKKAPSKAPIVAIAAAQDDHALRAIKQAMDLKIATPILVGDKPAIQSLMSQIGLPDSIEIIHEPDVALAATKAVALVKEGRAHILMKGLVNTAIFLRAVLRSEIGLRTDKTLSHLAMFEVPGQKKILFMTDVALNTFPNQNQKKELLINAMEALHKIGIPMPKVAILSANETVSEKMPASVDAQIFSEMSKRGELPAGIVEGPLALDVIESEEAAHHKGIPSQVAGHADLILVPDIETGNAVAKALSHYAGGTMSGILLGATAPIIVNSRSDSAKGKFFSLVLAEMVHNAKN